jgi:cell cycle sensor histidine kinase DivJ
VFDLGEVASSAIGFVAQAAERAGVTLKLSVEPGADQIFADRRAVKQMLINLLNNGVKFTPRGGEVRVEAIPGRGGLILSVSDTGTGIAQKDLDRLGQPFEQVESPQTRAKEGTGLGLALVRSLAALHGGEMTLESALGLGTIVRIRLPFAVSGGTGAKILPFRGAA